MAIQTVSPLIDRSAPFARSVPEVAGLSFTYQILRDQAGYAAHTAEIRALRQQTEQDEDVTTDPAWFVAKTISEKRRPWLVLVRQSSTLVAVLLLAEKCFYSVPTGYLRGGDGFGQGFLIASSSFRGVLLRAGLQAIFKQSGAQLLLLSLDGALHQATQKLQPAAVQLASTLRPAQYRLPLCPTVDATFKLFGSHTRRNFRYYMRKAVEDKWTFHPKLDREAAAAAVLELTARTTHPIPVEEALRRLELMHATPGSFSLGLEDAAGEWLSYLSGWRQGRQTFVYFQMNEAGRSRASISTVMRSYLIEQEVGRGAREIVFLDGTSSMMARGCIEDSCVDVLLYRRNLRSFLVNRVFAGLLDYDHPLRMNESVHPPSA